MVIVSGFGSWSDLVNLSDSCVISEPRNEFLYLTGNYYGSYSKKVSQYGPQGFLADLPELITGRGYHACTGYYDGSYNFVLLVAGGWYYNGMRLWFIKQSNCFILRLSILNRNFWSRGLLTVD